MYVRQAWNSDEDWILNKLEELEVSDEGFRSRDYVLALRENDSKCGIGRLDIHEDYCIIEFVNIFKDINQSECLNKIVKSLIKKASEEDFDTVFYIGEESPSDYFEMDTVSEDDVPFETTTEDEIYEMDVKKTLGIKTSEERIEELAEEFGYDDDVSTKYSID